MSDTYPVMTELNRTYDTNLLDIKSDEDQVKYINYVKNFIIIWMTY